MWQRTAKNGKVCFLFSRKIEIFGVEHTCITEYFGGYFFRMCWFLSCILQDFWNVNRNTVACETFWSKATFNFQTNSFIVCLIQYVCWRWYSHPKRKQMLSLSVRFAQAENEEICKRHKCLLDGDWISAIALWYLDIEIALFWWDIRLENKNHDFTLLLIRKFRRRNKIL